MIYGYYNLAVALIKRCIDDYCEGDMTKEEYKDFCYTNTLIQYMGLSPDWVYRLGLQQKEVRSGKKNI